MLAPQTYTPSASTMEMDQLSQPQRMRRKRKAEAQPENHERLSKRMSLLNLEQSGAKLYVPVENPLSQSATSSLPPPHYPVSPCRSGRPGRPRGAVPDDTMQLDDTKHKVYIYNLDDELSDSEPESVGDHDGRLVFLSDIEKHMRNNRIPAHILSTPAAADDAAGRELVLYKIPRSISVPEERDSVRKAIIEARARLREKQRVERDAGAIGEHVVTPTSFELPGLPTIPEMDLSGDVDVDEVTGLDGVDSTSQTNGTQMLGSIGVSVGEDPDAMDLD